MPLFYQPKSQVLAKFEKVFTWQLSFEPGELYQVDRTAEGLLVDL